MNMSTISSVFSQVAMLCAVMLLAAAGPSALAAQEAQSPAEAPDIEASADVSPGVSPGVAQMVSVLATLGPIAAGLAAQSPELFATGFYLGPATGYWIGGAAGRGWAGVGLRAGATLLGSGLVAATWGESWAPSDEAAVVSLGVLGVLVYLVVDDLVEVDDAVAARRAERSRARPAEGAIELSPIVSPSDGGTVGFVGRVRL